MLLFTLSETFIAALTFRLNVATILTGCMLAPKAMVSNGHMLPSHSYSASLWHSVKLVGVLLADAFTSY